ncbi:MAG TPA: hypothetical protein VK629_02070 [Steroidobacteraceae bacterium]|nr:hypothetical protein [Steroidobacteraceae bacterium]
MKTANAARLRLPSKLPTGIRGFDELSYGGVTENRTALLMGGPGFGTTDELGRIRSADPPARGSNGAFNHARKSHAATRQRAR